MSGDLLVVQEVVETESTIITADRARVLMGKNFFGVADWQQIFGATFTDKELQYFKKFPYTEEDLTAPCPFIPGREVRETHFAYSGMPALHNKPLTINRLVELRGIGSGGFASRRSGDLWFASEKAQFAEHTTSQPSWYLMFKGLLPGSLRKSFAQQRKMLPQKEPFYYVPKGVEVVLMHLLCLQQSGELLNPYTWGRCQDPVSRGRCPVIGKMSGQGLEVGYNNIDFDAEDILNAGLFVSRCLPQRS